MRVIVINTGTELLLGDVINTHLRFISREIFALGLRIARQLTVPDGPAIQEALRESFSTADMVFVTGGLGPTTDDITRDAAAELLGLQLRRDERVVAAITERLVTRGFEVTSAILRQAYVPEGALVLPNANGTAPGLYVAAAAGTPHLFLLPGPPRELHPMFRDSVAPILRGIAPRSVGASRTLRLACVGESVVEAAVGAEILALGEVELGYCARAGEVDVRVIGTPATLDAAEVIIRKAFPDGVFTAKDESLEEVVVRLLTERSETVATAESCTGGYLAHRITNVTGSSAVFLAGYVTYANQAKIDALGIEETMLQEHGAVSELVARTMAEGARARAGATYALATTGIAGPGGGTDEKPVGTVCIALAAEGLETQFQRLHFVSDRETFKQHATQAALDLLRRRLLAR